MKIGWHTYSEWSGSKTKLESVQLVEEDGQYFLDLIYDVETKSERFKLRIPRVRLDISKDRAQVCYDPALSGDWKCRANIGISAHQYVKADENGYYYTETTYEKRTREMTIEELEKLLGYRIKIVGKD